MKKFYLVGMMVVGSLALSAQTFLQNSVDFGGDDYMNAMTMPLPDGSRYAIGSTSNTGAGSYDILLTKLDSLGNVVWAKQYGGSGFDAGRNITLTADHHLILTGSSGSFTSNNDAIAIKTDLSGAVIWAKVIGTSAGDDFSYKVAEAQDSSLLMIGQTKGAAKDNNKGEMLLVKMDKDGNALWTKSLGSVNGVELGYEGWNIGSDGYVVGGQSSLGLIGGTDVAIHLISLTGDLVMTALIGGPADDDARKFAPAPGGLIIAGNTRSFGAPNQGDMFVTSVYGTATGLALKFFKRIGNPVDESLTAFNFDGRDGYIGSALSNGNSGLIFAVDTNGAVKWSTVYDSSASEVIMEANAGPDGVFGIGYSNSFGGSANSGYVVKANMNGITPCLSNPITLNDSAINATLLGPALPDYTADTLVTNNADVTATITTTTISASVATICTNSVGIATIEKESFMAVVYPNPATSIVNIAADKMINNDAVISITDITGRIVKKLANEKAGIVSINTSDWQSGFYLVKITIGNQETVKRFIVK